MSALGFKPIFQLQFTIQNFFHHINLFLVLRKDSKIWLFMEETAQQMKRPFGIPEKPEFTVGLDVPLSTLKMNVLSEGASVIVLTGLGGSGKTTLATMLCRDEQVMGMLLYMNILLQYFVKC